MASRLAQCKSISDQEARIEGIKDQIAARPIFELLNQHGRKAWFYPLTYSILL